MDGSGDIRIHYLSCWNVVVFSGYIINYVIEVSLSNPLITTPHAQRIIVVFCTLVPKVSMHALSVETYIYMIHAHCSYVHVLLCTATAS